MCVWCICLCVEKMGRERGGWYDPGEGDGLNTMDGRGGLRFWKGAAEKLLLLNLQ